MNNPCTLPNSRTIETAETDTQHWQINAGGRTIHAKRMGGKWRRLKWLGASTWLVFFLGPYIRWGERQAVLFDIPHRQFHIFNVTLLPQDFWMLSLTLLFFAILLAVVTALAGRVWCGYFCFQTVWTDLFTGIETLLEGAPTQRRKLDSAPLSWHKLRIKTFKHFIWGCIGLLTGISFTAWFTDAYRLWLDLFTLNAGSITYWAVCLFTIGAYILAGWLREQTCFWLCPYARIQGVMVDTTTLLPTYDFRRGEPRGGMKKDGGYPPQRTGDCVDGGQCVAVCPTGVDIRDGQQEGCITCGLCIDACDAVMDKLGRPPGLIRYASLDEIEGNPTLPLIKRPRVWVYSAILVTSLIGIGFGFYRIEAVELTVLHERSPLFVRQSDGTIQNKYYLKVLNKMNQDLSVRISATGLINLHLIGADTPLIAVHGGVTPTQVFIKVPKVDLSQETTPITFHLTTQDLLGHPLHGQRDSVFIAPER